MTENRRREFVRGINHPHVSPKVAHLGQTAYSLGYFYNMPTMMGSDLANYRDRWHDMGSIRKRAEYRSLLKSKIEVNIVFEAAVICRGYIYISSCFLHVLLNTNLKPNLTPSSFSSTFLSRSSLLN